MNVDHVKDEIKVEGDMLEAIFEYQRIVKERFDEVEKRNGLYVPDKINIDSPKDQDYLKGLMYRVVTELVEATECLKNKPWKTTHVMTDVTHLKEELADALHFFVEFCIVIGMDAKELFAYYMKKNKVNNWRIDTKY